MITRIELTNFMSHEHTVIEPAAGLTVLVGPNNVGKSAVVAALQILCHNENSTYVLRHGEKECLVEIETDDGHKITWRRKTSPSYIVDGQVFDRLRGAGLPEELHRVLRLPKVEAGGDADFDIHFGSQKSPIFLLGSSSATAARFFASSSDAIRLVSMQKRHKEKLAEAQREKNGLEARSKRLNAELELLEGVVDVDHRLEIVERVYNELIREAGELAAAYAHETKLREQSELLEQHAARAATLEGLAEPPRLTPTEPLVNWIAAAELATARQAVSAAQALVLAALAPPPELSDVALLADLTARIASLTASGERAEGECRALSGLMNPPPLSETAALQTCVDGIVAAAASAIRAEQRSAAFSALASPPELKDEAALSRLIQSIDQCDAQIDRHQHEIAAMTDLASPPVPTETVGLVSCIAQYVTVTTEIRAYETSLTAACAELESAAVALRSLAERSSCSACGAPLDPDRVVARAAAGLGEHAHD